MEDVIEDVIEDVKNDIIHFIQTPITTWHQVNSLFHIRGDTSEN